MEEISVGPVDIDKVKSDRFAPIDRGDIRRLQLVDVFDACSNGASELPSVERDWRRCHHCIRERVLSERAGRLTFIAPTPILGTRDSAALPAVVPRLLLDPRGYLGCLPAGVRELDSNLAVVRVNVVNDPLESRYMLVGPDSLYTVRSPSDEASLRTMSSGDILPSGKTADASIMMLPQPRRAIDP
jgi:hypothetical protein